MRVHLLCPPNAPTSEAFPLEGFAQMSIRFARILQRLGIEHFTYGTALNEAPSRQHYVCISEDERKRCLGETPYQEFRHDPGTEMFTLFNAKAAHQIAKIKQPHDVIATIMGTASLPVWQQHPELTDLEYSIGYRGVCARYRVYQSQTWRACAAGYTGTDLIRPFDNVIYPFYDVGTFPYVEKPGDYLLYCGRLTQVKGLHIACDAAKKAGVPLKIIGHGDQSQISYGEYIGDVNNEARNLLMAHARAVMVPTIYIEPFGNVCAEAQLCGTPVISTDGGAFVESVLQGVTGYRCVTMGDFVAAIELVQGLNRQQIRKRAIEMFSMETAEDAYRRYFKRLEQVTVGEGFESLDTTLPRYVAA